jgi:hypothetical protein
MYWKDSGAYTGEISAPMLLDAGCKYVVLGHSERRGRFGVPEPDLEGQAGNVFGDSDQSVNKKLHAALQHGLIPIVCVGETLTERQNGHTDAVVQNQTAAALEDIHADQASTLIFAYEPVWAIGTGETCASDEADRVCGVIRATIASAFGEKQVTPCVFNMEAASKPITPPICWTPQHRRRARRRRIAQNRFVHERLSKPRHRRKDIIHPTAQYGPQHSHKVLRRSGLLCHGAGAMLIHHTCMAASRGFTTRTRGPCRRCRQLNP